MTSPSSEFPGARLRTQAPKTGLRVLVVSQHFWPETFRINEVVESLRACGAQVEVLTGQPNYPKGEIFEGYSALGRGTERHPSGYTIHRVPLLSRGRHGSGLRRIGNYLSFVASCILFAPGKLRDGRFDVIFVYAISPILQGLPAAWLKRSKGAALVIWVQDLWPDSLKSTGYVRNETVLAAVGSLTRFIYRRADLLLVQSRGFAEVVRQRAGADIPVAFHPNPGDLSLTDAVDGGPDMPAAIAMPENGFNVVFAGNLGFAQALETILGAAERLADPAIRIFLVGSGSRSDWLRQEIARRSLRNVELSGRFQPDAMPAIFARASALLVTLKRGDNLSLTIPSKIPCYLGTARPVIACLDGEGAQVVREAGAGVIVAAEDADGLASAIVMLKAMPIADRLAMGRNGRAYYEKHFAPEPLARRLIQHFYDAISRRRGAAQPEIAS